MRRKHAYVYSNSLNKKSKMRPFSSRFLFLAVFFLSAPAPLYAATPCPNEGGNPNGCSQEEVASLPTNLPKSAVANINVVNGNAYQREVDISPLPGELGIELVRHYNSKSNRAGPLGFGWSYGYETELKRIGAHEIHVRQADGRRVVFNLDETKRYRGVSPTDGHIEVTDKLYRWKWPSGKVLSFDEQGWLTGIKKPAGSHLSFTYAPNKTLVAITDQAERRLSFDTDKQRRITRIRTPLGAIAYAYDKFGNLTKVTYPDNTHKRYEYRDPADAHNLTAVIDRNGGQTSFAYDNQDRAISTAKSQGIEALRLAYQKGGTIVTNSKGHQTFYETAYIQQTPIVTAVTGAGCASCGATDSRYKYNDQAQLTEVMEQKLTTRYSYDKLGRVSKLYRLAANAKPQLIGRYEYHRESNYATLMASPSILKGQEKQTAVTYNARYQPLEVSEVGYSPDGQKLIRVIRFAYDKANNLVAVDGPLPGQADTTRYVYNDKNRLIQTIYPEKLTTRVLAFDALGYPAKIENADKQVSEFSYQQGRLTTLTQNKLTTRFSYDAEGRPTKITRPDGVSYRAVYDPANRLTHIIDGAGNQQVLARDTENNVTEFALFEASTKQYLNRTHSAYNDMNRLAQVTAADGVTHRYTYNPQGQLASVIDSLNRISQYQYNDQGRPSQFVKAAHTTTPAITHVTYDANGLPIRLTDANGNATTQAFDDFGNKVITISPDAGISLYRYDEANRLIAKINESGVTSRYTYDAANRLIAAGADNEPHLMRYFYQGARLIQIAEPSQTTRYRYNAQGQLIDERKTMLGHSYMTTYNWDALGRLSTKTLDGQTLHYRYGTKNGELQAVSLSNESHPKLRQPIVNNLERRPFGPIASYTQGNAISTRFTYDKAGKLVNLKTIADKEALAQSMGRWHQFKARLKHFFTNNQLASHNILAKPLLELSYSYDHAARTTRIKRNSQDESYAYDDLDHLVKVKMPGREEVYQYDALGNRLMASVNGNIQRYSYAAGSNRLLGIVGEKGAAQSLFVKDGTGTTIEGADRTAASSNRHRTVLANYRYTDFGTPYEMGQKRIAYNAAGRPLAVYEDNQLVATYRYNAQGERIAKTVYKKYSLPPGMQKVALTSNDVKPVAGNQGTTTYYLYDHQQLVAEANERGKITAHYVYLGHRPIAKIEPTLGRDKKQQSVSAIYFIHSDHLGTPQLATDFQQNIIWRASVTPFGEATINAGKYATGKPFTLNLRFPGQYYDEETGLHYNYQREYDPKTGRYLTSDPIGLSGGMNTYSYVGGDPISGIDPLGLYEEDVHYYMTFFLARVAGLSPQQAFTIATAAQYIDDNPLTAPYDSNVLSGLNYVARPLYHFTQKPGDDSHLYIAYGARGSQFPVYDTANRYINPEASGRNHQLANLRAPAFDFTLSPCARAQFYGEYLHAFQDTFSHRDPQNVPYGAVRGHVSGNHDPDQTYNVRDFQSNEARALQMEREVFDHFKQDFGLFASDRTGFPIQFNDVLSTLISFNVIGKERANVASMVFENDAAQRQRKQQELELKIKFLDAKLRELGLGSFNDVWEVPGNCRGGNCRHTFQYFPGIGESNRHNYLGGLRHETNPATGQDRFDGVLLPSDRN